MPSTNSQTPDNDDRRLFARRIIDIAVGESGQVPGRSAMSLAACGVLDLDTSGPSDETVAKLRSAVDEPGDWGLGPAVFYDQGPHALSMTEIVEVLLDHRTSVRAIAIDYLRSCALPPGVLSARTRRAVEALSGRILTSQPENWCLASAELAGVVDEDWLYNVAAVRQYPRHLVQDAWSHRVTCSLRPSFVSINGCTEGVVLPHHENAISRKFDHWRTEQCSLTVKIDAYLGELGHLPLAEPFSLGRLVRSCRTPEADRSPADALLSAAASTPSPLVKYHACEALLSLPILTDTERAAVSTLFWDAVIPAADTSETTPGQEQWRLVEYVTTYFLHHLELTLCTDDGETVAAMASWMADRLVVSLGGDAQQMRHFREQVERFHGTRTDALRDLLAVPMRWSPLHGTMSLGLRHWSAGLCDALRDGQQVAWLMEGPGPGNRRERLNAMIRAVVQSTGYVFEKGEPRFRFTEPLHRVLTWIAEASQDEQERRELRGWAEPIDWDASGTLGAILDGCGGPEDFLERWKCGLIRRRVASGGFSPQELWDAMSRSEWKASKALALKPDSLQTLGYALIDVAAIHASEWTCEVPHLFVDLAEQCDDNEDRLTALFSLVIRAATSLNGGSAVVRLLRGPARERYRQFIDPVRVNFENAMPHAGRWGSGRLRALFALLAQ